MKKKDAEACRPRLQITFCDLPAEALVLIFQGLDIDNKRNIALV